MLINCFSFLDRGVSLIQYINVNISSGWNNLETIIVENCLLDTRIILFNIHFSNIFKTPRPWLSNVIQ